MISTFSTSSVTGFSLTAIKSSNQKKADLGDKGIVLNIQQTINSSGAVDYDKIIQNTYTAVFGALKGVQDSGRLPAPVG